MADGEASGEQRLDVPVGPDADTELEFQPIARDGVDHPFDAFDATTWHFKPAPDPWHRTRPAVLGLVAVGLAVVVLVVSVVVLSFRSDDAVPARRSTTVPTPSPTTSPMTSPTATSAVPVETSSAVPTSPAPPPAAAPPPVGPPRTESRPTKKPEFNVTRAPMSASPQPRGGSR